MQFQHRSAWVLLLAGVATSGAACGDASSMFGGMWRSESVLTSGWVTGRPELALGHFGPEITGIVRFLDGDGLPTQPCACAYVDQLDVDLTAQAFAATTLLCDDSSLLIWELALDDDGATPRLVGQIRRAGDDSAPAQPVSFRLDDRFVPDDNRDECIH